MLLMSPPIVALTSHSCTCLQVAAELHAVVREARRASLVHLAPDALPNMPRDPLSFIEMVEDTAVAVHLLADDYDTVKT